MSEATERTLSERLLKSRLVDAVQLAAARAAVGDDDKEVLKRFVDTGVLTRFQSRQLRGGSTVFHVGNYVVVDYLGSGGNSVIFKARHTLLTQRYVALKTLEKNNLHNEQDALARFRREIDILSRLDHPNVVRAYDVLQTRKQIYLVLEYIEGGDLGKVVRERGPLPIPEAVGYAVQAARGLGYAHRSGIVHRDLKPANLLLAGNGVVKLLDLGLARVVAEELDSELSAKGLCMGTPEYMAPEQAEDSSNADAKSDLYSLGSTLFHLLTAELPVKGGSYLHRLKSLLIEPPRPMGDARPDIPKELAAVVDRLRSRDPAARPGSAEETIALLEPFAKQPPPDDPSRWNGRRRAALMVDILQGRVAVADACQRHGLAEEEIERWRRRFLEGAEQALDPSGQGSGTAGKALRDLHAKIGAQAMEIESLREQLASVNREG